MANAVVPRLQGDDYQACFFWLRACQLFQDYNKVTKVAYEDDEIKSFDDVVSFYEPSIRDNNGELVDADYYQIKFHATQNGSFTWEKLMDPAFINATSHSFLKKLYNAQQKMAVNGQNYRFYLVSPWVIETSDPLTELVSNNAGELRLDKLFNGGGPKSKMGKVRDGWCKHLELQKEDDLREILRPLRIIFGYKNSEELLKELNRELYSVGLKPIENGALVNPYSNLIQRLFINGRKMFSREELTQICKNENLWIERNSKAELTKPIGIRSYSRRAENMEHETESMLCLIKHFDGRYIKENVCWNDDVALKVEEYLNKELQSGEKVDIHLDTHASIAFTAGYCLDPKSGIDVAPVQRGNGRFTWRPDATKKLDDYPEWKNEVILKDESAKDIAVALSIRHNVVNEVEEYLTLSAMNVNRIISFYPGNGPSATSIVDASHAFLLADKIVGLLKKRTLEERKAQIHLFISGPNAFCFFLGQLSRVLGRITVYEYDFEQVRTCTYIPAISLPLRHQ